MQLPAAEKRSSVGRASQVPHSWIPLSTFTFHCPHADAPPQPPHPDCSKESRLVQCYSVNVQGGSVDKSSLSPQKQTAEYGVAAESCGEKNAHGLKPSTSASADESRGVGVGPGLGDEVHGVAGGGQVESAAAAAAVASGPRVESCTASSSSSSAAEGGRKTGHKDRILEEISAWFSDNAG